ncbi:MAG: zinc metalloprotease HtpX [Candidatus Competibacterales bacterium]|nr:zinc metalloprotease HtpX [Candidatus Competibacterales bacterium]
MNPERIREHQWHNALQSVLLIGAMTALLGLVGWIVAGPDGLVLGLLACGLLSVLGIRISPRLVLRLYRARPIPARAAPDLHRVLEILCQRAGLVWVPQLYYVPTPVLNAFAVGHRDEAAIALTDGLLQRLGSRELVAVLAHELSHVRHNDMWVMNLADLISRVTVALSQVGLLLLLLGLPLALLGMVSLSLPALLLLILAPTLMALLQLALSRTREYEADRGAVELTGDPRALASALYQLERHQGGWLERVLMPGRREPDPALLRSHPATEDRIARLRELAHEERRHPPGLVRPPTALDDFPRPGRRPRWHLNGLWY